MDITVKIDAPELTSALAALAEAMRENQEGDRPEVVAEMPVEPAKSSKKTKTEEKAPEKETLTLETVRAKLAAISQSDKQDEVRGLIEKYGAAKLTDIPTEKYADLMADAEALG